MEAIFGVWHLDETPAQQCVLERMAAALAIAPSKQSVSTIRCEGPIGFGRLSIGRNRAKQPVTQASNLLCIADARLYRAPGTDAPLDLSAPERESLLCSLHAQFGNEAPNHLEGDFAYVLWDKSEQRLTLVRDHIGVRPLFYFYRPGKFFVWASHSDLIFGSGVVDSHLNLEAVCRDLVGDRSDMEETAMQGLKKLPAAHLLHVSPDGRHQKHRYWQLECVDPITDNSSFEDCAFQLKRLLEAAVCRRLRSSETVGAHLSGGLDSSSVAVMASRHLAEEERPLHTYSFVAENRQDVQFVDERPYVDATVQGEPNIRSTKISPPDYDQHVIDAAYDRLAAYCGAEEKVLAAADTDSVDALLSGWGGDEGVSFNGRGAYAEHFLHGRWRTLWSEINERAALLEAPRKSVFANEVVAYILPTNLTNLIRRAFGKEPGMNANEAANPLLLARVGRGHRPLSVRAASARKNRLTLFQNGHIAYRLENWALQGMHHGVRYAFPLLDRDLLEYSMRLPASFFKRNGLGRAIFREAMKDELPENLRISRQKLVPFPCSFLRASERKSEHLKELAALRKNSRLSQIFDFEALEQALEKVPEPNAVKEAFNAEAAGGVGPSWEAAQGLEMMMLARFLGNRLPD